MARERAAKNMRMFAFFLKEGVKLSAVVAMMWLGAIAFLIVLP